MGKRRRNFKIRGKLLEEGEQMHLDNEQKKVTGEKRTGKKVKKEMVAKREITRDTSFLQYCGPAPFPSSSRGLGGEGLSTPAHLSRGSAYARALSSENGKEQEKGEGTT